MCGYSDWSLIIGNVAGSSTTHQRYEERPPVAGPSRWRDDPYDQQNYEGGGADDVDEEAYGYGDYNGHESRAHSAYDHYYDEYD